MMRQPRGFCTPTSSPGAAGPQKQARMGGSGLPSPRQPSLWGWDKSFAPGPPFSLPPYASSIPCCQPSRTCWGLVPWHPTATPGHTPSWSPASLCKPWINHLRAGEQVNLSSN